MSLEVLGEIIKTDVLVIGGGAAGIRAAIEAKDNDADVILAVKGKFTRTGSSFFPLMDAWGMQAAWFPDDSPEEHFKEILEAGLGMCDIKLARVLAEEAPIRLLDLEKWGIKFRKKEGNFIRGRGCFSRKARAVVTEDMENVRSVFQGEVRKRGIKILEGTMITDLLTQDGVCLGAVGIKDHRQIMSIKAKSTILATGGGSSVFKNSLTSSEVTGDGQIIALEAGAELFNMEFVQFIYAILYPRRLIFRERAFKVHPRIYNRDHDSYVKKYLPEGIDDHQVLNERAKHGPFTSRLLSRYFDIATYKEIIEGRSSEHGGIYFDLRGMKQKEQRQYPMIDHWLKWLSQFNIDPSQTIFEIAPSAHALNGGIRVNERAETNIDGLFAAGEVMSGPHGADRLGGNMMSLTQVFGARAGKYAAQQAKEKQESPLNMKQIRQINEKFKLTKGSLVGKNSGRAHQIRNCIQGIMWENVAICRTEEGLSRAVGQLENLATDSLPYLTGSDIQEILSLHNALKISQVITQASWLRKESRGPHYREDFPCINDKKFGKCIIVRKEKEKFAFSWKDINSRNQ